MVLKLYINHTILEKQWFWQARPDRNHNTDSWWEKQQSMSQEEEYKNVQLFF